MRGRVLFAVLVVLSTAIVSAGPAHSAPGNHRIPALAGTTIIRARSSVSMLVRMPKGSTIADTLSFQRPNGPNDDVRIFTHGSMAVVGLLPVPHYDFFWEGLFEGATFNDCNGSRCTPHHHANDRTNFPVPGQKSAGQSRRYFKAGTYRLYVMAIAPTRIVLHFRGLAGKTVLRPQGRADGTIRSPRTRLSMREGQTVVNAASKYPMKTHFGIFASAVVVRDDQYSGGTFQECLASSRPPLPDQWFMGPQCEAVGYGWDFVNYKRIALPGRGGWLMVTTGLLNDTLDNQFNGDSHMNYFGFTTTSPGPISEIWSDAGLLSLR